MAKEIEQLNRNGNRRGMHRHPNSLKNLEKRHGGHKHTSKDYSITRIVKEMLDEPADERWLDVHDKDKKLTWRQAIAKALLVGSIRGNAKLMSELLDRIEGKVTQPVANEGEITLRVKYDDSD